MAHLSPLLLVFGFVVMLHGYIRFWRRTAEGCGVCCAEWLAHLAIPLRSTVANSIAPAQYRIFVLLFLRLYAGLLIRRAHKRIVTAES